MGGMAGDGNIARSGVSDAIGRVLVVVELSLQIRREDRMDRPPVDVSRLSVVGSILDECGLMALQASRQQPSLGAGCGDTTCD